MKSKDTTLGHGHLFKRHIEVIIPTTEQLAVEQLKRDTAARIAKELAPAWTPPGCFPFFDLPAELRTRILEYALILPRPVDLDLDNTLCVAPRLKLLRCSRRLHAEAQAVFYGRNTFRIFVTNPFKLKTKKVLLSRLSPRCRAAITSLELRLGPGWSSPPKTWVISPKLGLADCSAVRRLRVFIQLDPSAPMFLGFRRGDDPAFYTHFSLELLRGILSEVPTIAEIEFDAFDAVPRTCELLQSLLQEATAARKRIVWGTEKDWDAPEEEAFDMARLQNALVELRVGA